jgi:hypothetical protein
MHPISCTRVSKPTSWSSPSWPIFALLLFFLIMGPTCHLRAAARDRVLRVCPRSVWRLWNSEEISPYPAKSWPLLHEITPINFYAALFFPRKPCRQRRQAAADRPLRHRHYRSFGAPGCHRFRASLHLFSTNVFSSIDRVASPIFLAAENCGTTSSEIRRTAPLPAEGARRSEPRRPPPRMLFPDDL